MFLGELKGEKQSMTEEELRRLSWRCRRGLLELDIVLQRFSEKYLSGLTVNELMAFDALLDLPDNEFLDVVTLRKKSNEVEVLKEKQLDELAMQSVLAKLNGHAQISG